ncbi:uncharacterized protein TNCT_384731 [Trichonephila clavata]|uniref:Uncharacterized protein n=1 Tax=Trichonephila clavata TaxID=2740835 RepID=A0A8X6IHV6_TRICU|nr:uncharacterized protein TNCT_384731 [Trichonephila clavata]
MKNISFWQPCCKLVERRSGIQKEFNSPLISLATGLLRQQLIETCLTLSGWSTCKEEILGYTDSNGTDSHAILYMCGHNKTRLVEDCMKKSGKKVNRKARAKMMVCMMKILT